VSSRVTIGETARPANIRNVRGAVTVGVIRRENVDGGEPMIGITAAVGGTSCSARLTIGEAEMLRDALDTMITEATAGSRHHGASLNDEGSERLGRRGERSIMAELLTAQEVKDLQREPGRWLLPGAPP